MTCFNRRIVAAVCLFVLAGSARAQLRAISSNPYKLIIDRNIFGLRPVVAPSAKQSPLAIPQIILTGLSTITGRKLALLKLEFPPKPAQKQKEELCILKEGESDGPVRVLHIDMKAQSVQVDNSGTIDVLTFEKNGPKPSPSAATSRLPALSVRR